MQRRRTVYRSLNLEISWAGRSILRGGEALRPRAKVFDLLLHLIECRDRLLTKEELMERLWPDAKVGENSLAQCVNDLRKVLGDDARNPRFIRTVPKVGYQFFAPVEESEPESPWIYWKWLPAPILMVLLLVLVLNPAWRKTEQPRGEVAWWRFDEGAGTRARDSSGHGNDGVLRDGLVWADGKLGKAIQFDGIRGQVAGTNPGRSFPRGGAARTVSAWIRAASTNGDITSIFHYGTSGSPYNRAPPRRRVTRRKKTPEETV